MAENASDQENKPTIKFDDFNRLDIRVGHVVAAEPHPNADRLLKLQVDLGPVGQRQICAGIRPYYDPQALVGKQIAVVVNLEGRKIRGEVSEGMLLAASAESAGELTDVVVLETSRSTPAGAKVS